MHHIKNFRALHWTIYNLLQRGSLHSIVLGKEGMKM